MLNSSDDNEKLSVPFNYTELSLLATVCANFFNHTPSSLRQSGEYLSFAEDLRDMYDRLSDLIDENFE